MDSSRDSLTGEAASLLRERYGYLRAEMLQRLENRYKLLTAMLALVAVGFTVAVQLQKDAIALPVCATMLVLALVLQGENRHVQLISNYLITIERQLDAHCELKTPGWERFSRAKKGEKKLASNHLTLGALGFLTCFYLVFGAMGVRWRSEPVGGDLTRPNGYG